MLVESICIELIVAIMIFMFMRQHRNDYALLTAPLLIVPFFYICIQLGEELTSKALPTLEIVTDILGLAVAVALMGLAAQKLLSKKLRATYLILCGGFSATLAILFLLNRLVW